MNATSQVDKYEALPPPLPIGTKVRYTGNPTLRAGWARGGVTR